MTDWQIPSLPLHVEGTQLDLWQISLDLAPEEMDALEELLSSQERARARRFHFERDRRRYVVAHATLRSLLAEYTGKVPLELDFEVSAHGKPSLAGSGLFFNLAHSHELALIAVTTLGEVGVDVEYARALDDLDSLARACFSADEYREWQSLPAAQAHPAFFQAWARKEAFIKALGEGLSHPLQAFRVSLLPGEPAQLLEVAGDDREAARWTLHGIHLPAGYAGAVAIRAIGVECRYWNWNNLREVTNV